MSRDHVVRLNRSVKLVCGNLMQPLEARRLFDGTPGPERFLLGDTAAAPVNTIETEVQIAAGNSGYLAVWTDRRSMLGTERTAPLNVGLPGGGTDTDIFAVRLDAAGKAIGSSFAIYQGARADSVPQVDFNGTDYLVTWMSIPANDQNTRNIQAARVSSTGTVLDTTPIVIEQAINYNLNITHDALGNWLAVYTDGSSVLGRRISPTGALLEANSTQLIAGYPTTGGAFFHDGRFVLASYAAFSPVILYSFTPSLNFVSQTTVNHAGQIATDGNNMYMVWVDNVTPTTTDTAAFGSRVSDAGVLLDGAVQLTSPHQYSPEAKVTWDGANFQAVTLRASHFASVTHISPAGTVLNAGGTIIANAPQSLYGFATASHAGTTVATFIDKSIGSGSGSLNVQDISSAALLANNTVSPRGMISLAARNQMNVDLATGPGGFLSVYKDLESGHQRILAQRLDTAGHSIGSTPILLSQASDFATSPHVAFNGEVYMVTWYQQSGDALTGFSTGTYMRRVGINGQPLDAAPVLVVANQYAPDVAAVGNEFLLVSHFSNSFTGYTTWRRYNSAGQIVATNNISYSGPHQVKQLDVIAVGDRWLVLTENHYVADAFAQLNLTWIDRAGNQTTTIDVGTGQGRAYAPHLATSGNNVLMVYDHKTEGSYQDVWGRIIGLNNTVGAPFKIGVNGTADSSQSEAHVAWNGSEYIAAWIDHRNKQYPFVPEGDIYATRISEAGVVLDPDGVAVASSDAPDDAPTVHFGHGVTLLGYSTFDPAVDAGAMRVAVREIFSPLVVQSSQYRYATDATVELDFNADVSGSFTAGDVVLQNLQSGSFVSSTAIGLNNDTWNDLVRVQYTDINGRHELPNGDYRLTIAAGTIVSSTNQPLTADMNVDFFVMSADANRDRHVDTQDFNLLAANFGGTAKLFSQGNLDYDAMGSVNSTDFNVLVAQYGKSLPTIAASAAPAGALRFASPPVFSGVDLQSDHEQSSDAYPVI